MRNPSRLAELRLSRPAVLAFAPVLLVQGRRVGRTTPRLPIAGSPTGSVGSAGAEADSGLHVLVLGDSVAAGQGIGDHAQTVAGRTAARLHEATGRPTSWTVIARSGADAQEVADLARETTLPRADVIVLSAGVNDTKNLRSDARWTAGLRDLLDQVTASSPEAQVVLLGVPPMDVFPALPAPLSWLMAARARRLDDLGEQICRGYPQVQRLSLADAMPDSEAEADARDLFAADGFHPGERLHGLMAEWVVARRS